MSSPNDKKDIIDLLEYLDTHLNSNVILVFMGGTALTLLGEKELSNDIDVILIPLKINLNFLMFILRRLKI